MRLEDTFGICGDRALRITTLVRLMHGEGYEGVFGEPGSDRHQEIQQQLIDDLDESLRSQPGETIEQRWNNLMDDLNCQEYAENGVYLVPWVQYDTDDWQDPGVSQKRRE